MVSPGALEGLTPIQARGRLDRGTPWAPDRLVSLGKYTAKGVKAVFWGPRKARKSANNVVPRVRGARRWCGLVRRKVWCGSEGADGPSGGPKSLEMARRPMAAWTVAFWCFWPPLGAFGRCRTQPKCLEVAQDGVAWCPGRFDIDPSPRTPRSGGPLGARWACFPREIHCKRCKSCVLRPSEGL